MSASLARTLFKPAAAASASRAPAAVRQSVCPAARFFPDGAAASASTISARTLNAVAHVTVGTAVVASVISFLSHPDPLLFDHPPRSAIGLLPARYIAASPATDSTQSNDQTKGNGALERLPRVAMARTAGTERASRLSSPSQPAAPAPSAAALSSSNLHLDSTVFSLVHSSWRGLR
ncbi:hypothetical protein BMF94_1318 [Rhodotorula taiwanensis]|uniref:Uncharacterized protein n=1 Tax=Rhodotorula taiwanensis TaxID=741276 RepID=A0A2S5BFZ9_9BASI|nr:hypothetical protein BMF94_1318 [Rhodotorula taiwanensis]